MSDKRTVERAEGKLQEIGGSIKKNVGQLIGNEQMELEGTASEALGQAHQTSAKVGQRIKGAAEMLHGSVKGAVGDLIDNEQMQAEGKLEHLKGNIRQKLNQ